MFRELRLDVVHSHDDNPLLYASLATCWAGLRTYLHTQHHGKIPQITPRQEWLVGLASRRTDRFVCVSHDSARQMRRQGVPARKLLTLWNGIDLQRFAYHGPDPVGPIVAVGRLSPEKDHATLIQAMVPLVGADPTLRLEIAGEGPCRPELEQRIAEAKLAGNVRLLGQVDNVAELLSRARLFVLPSTTEGISLTLLEAQARGLPAVAMDVGGNPEVIEPGTTGLLVPARDPYALAAALQDVSYNSAKARSMGSAGRRRVERYFDVHQMVRAYETLYLDPAWTPNQEASA